MQKVADAADISVLFFQLVLIFEKATCKTMQALVPAAPVLHSSSANNASAISNVLSISVLSEPVLNSSSATNASVLFMVDWQFTVFCREVGFVVIYALLVLIFCGNICVCAI